MNAPKPDEYHGCHCGSGPAVDGHDDRERPFSFRHEEEDGNRLAVEALEAVQRRLDTALDRSEVGQLARLARGEVVHPDLLRLGRRREAERDPRGVGREDEVVRDAVSRERQVSAAGVAVVVLDHDHAPPRIVAEDSQIPFRLVLDLPDAAERVAGDRERVAALVRRAEEAGRVGEPDGLHVLGRALVGCHVDNLAAFGTEQEQVRVAAQLAELPGDHPTAVRGEVARGAQAAELERPLLPRLELTDDDVEVATVAAVRRIGEQPPVARDVRRPVVEARVADERPFLEDVELRPLVPALRRSRRARARPEGRSPVTGSA